VKARIAEGTESDEVSNDPERASTGTLVALLSVPAFHQLLHTLRPTAGRDVVRRGEALK